jgi:hypothetical protein
MWEARTTACSTLKMETANYFEVSDSWYRREHAVMRNVTQKLKQFLLRFWLPNAQALLLDWPSLVFAAGFVAYITSGVTSVFLDAS